MNIVFYLTSIIFFFWVVRNALFWVALWQLKEYRPDRLSVHLRETLQGRDLLFSPFSILKWITILGFIFVIFNNLLLLPYQLFVFFIFFVQFIQIIREIQSGLVKKPVFTFKALFIVVLSLFIISLFFLLPLVDRFVWMLLLDKFLVIMIVFIIFFFSFPTSFYRDLQVERAIKKIRGHKQLLVIGITGSYGKSSTKECVAQILGRKFKVLKTQGTNNTLIGIANTIISGLKDDTQIFVAEMGAYKKGEIEELCQVVKPKIGIITGVNTQHLSLFGSLKNTIEAKYELIKSLPSSGLAIFNGNNDSSFRLYKRTKKRKVLYQCLNNPKIGKPGIIYGYNVQPKKTSLTFDAMINRENIHLTTPLLGKQNVENILPAIYVAKYLGMNLGEIKEAASSLSPLPQTMTRQQLPNGVTLVDDTFNANPDAVLLAIDYMKIYRGKKILVLQPMIELGKDAEKEHYKVALKISRACDYLFLTNKNFYQSILKGIKDGNGHCLVEILSLLEISKFVTSSTTSNDIIVFEGKEASRALSKISSSC